MARAEQKFRAGRRRFDCPANVGCSSTAARRYPLSLRALQTMLLLAIRWSAHEKICTAPPAEDHTAYRGKHAFPSLPLSDAAVARSVCYYLPPAC